MFQEIFQEDDLFRNYYFTHKLPTDMVLCQLKFKSPLLLAGLPFFYDAFQFLGAEVTRDLSLEGKELNENSKPLSLCLPFNQAILGERIALNLLTRATSIATYTAQFVNKAKHYNIAILDTRKTTPGLRALEKYAVVVGGGKNHRIGQSDAFMIKDNHKVFFGSIEKALEFFKSLGGFYNPIIVEVSNLEEISTAIACGIKHLLLDNFTPEMVTKSLALKKDGITFEISGGITLENLSRYLIKGVDAISIGSLTQFSPRVDISLKIERT